ncbi:hypothetical protein QVD17_24938 [Tagetes erecta]|uniref:BSD domain-containing protein n=1 Tax=Tagetes erecta TaxID=13708 RepID=A0AAD8NMZ4_TARER|nr:hypothetical protein QVD17_24938 [Tagetes erecta]
MSWFTRSIANTFNLDDDDEDNAKHISSNNNNISTEQKVEPEDDSDSPLSPGRGVKEDLSEITKTLTSKLWGVASFLAPPVEHSNQQPDVSDPEDVEKETVFGIRRDFAEIGGRFRSGISKLSSNLDVSEITKLASSMLQLSEDEAIGVTDEVLDFVRDVTMHPETWMNFPLSDDEDDAEDFELSDAQQEHALAVERLAPRLAALRIELCPGYMSESSFWKIYFVLLHPRLEPDAAELLSTPEIVKARASLAPELKAGSSSLTQEKHASVSADTQSETMPVEISTTPLTTSVVSTDTEKSEKQPVSTEEVVDKSVIQEEPRNETRPENQKVHSNTPSTAVEDKDEDDWLKEDTSENVNISTATSVPIENDEDVSFSDLEEDDDDDDGDTLTKYQKPTSRSDSSTKESCDSSTAVHAGQVSAHSSEMNESNDWLDVDDIDVA